jgi:hypothetical protein
MNSPGFFVSQPEVNLTRALEPGELGEDELQGILNPLVGIFLDTVAKSRVQQIVRSHPRENEIAKLARSLKRRSERALASNPSPFPFSGC